MKIHTQKYALAATGSMGIWYAVCAALCWMWPQQALQLTAPLLHMRSLELFAPYFHVTLAGFFNGLIQSMVYTYLYVWLFGWLYNLIDRS